MFFPGVSGNVFPMNVFSRGSRNCFPGSGGSSFIGTPARIRPLLAESVSPVWKPESTIRNTCWLYSFFLPTCISALVSGFAYLLFLLVYCFPTFTLCLWHCLSGCDSCKVWVGLVVNKKVCFFRKPFVGCDMKCSGCSLSMRHHILKCLLLSDVKAAGTKTRSCRITYRYNFPGDSGTRCHSGSFSEVCSRAPTLFPIASCLLVLPLSQTSRRE